MITTVRGQGYLFELRDEKITASFFPALAAGTFSVGTAAVVLVLSLAYGMVALIGLASVSIKPRFGCYVARAICSYPCEVGKQ